MAKKKTSKKATGQKKAARRPNATRSSAAVPAAAALAMDTAQADEFYADELKIGKNAETADERRITRGAAMILWREEDIGALLRDETGKVWGWSLRRY